MTTVLRGDHSYVDGAALVWAEATAARDGSLEVAPLEVARPIIAGVVERSRAVFVVAVDESGQVVAFAVAAPADESSVPGSMAEVEYLGVSPRNWGAGLARDVLRRLCAELAVAGFTDARLLVYSDNHRAIRLYEQLGWQPYGTLRPHPRTGKLQHRYRRALTRGGTR